MIYFMLFLVIMFFAPTLIEKAFEILVPLVIGGLMVLLLVLAKSQA